MKNRDALVECVHKATNRPDIEIGELYWLTDWRPNIRIVNKYAEGRAFVIGDAAHIHTPAGGQGANTGMQDGFNLGWKLALVYNGLAKATLLDSFSEERLPVAKDMLVRTTAALEAQLAFRAGGNRAPPLHPSLFKQLGVNYRWSSIVVDEQPGQGTGKDMAAYLPEDNAELRAGDRAPEAPGLRLLETDVQNTTRNSLFSIFKPTRHTVLLFNPDSAKVAALKAVLSTLPQSVIHTVAILPREHDASFRLDGIDEVLVDLHGHAYTAYKPVKEGYNVIIVRPDGVLGAVLRGPHTVDKYTKVVFGQTGK